MIKNRLEVTEKIIAAKVSKGLTWEKVAKEPQFDISHTLRL